VLFCDGEAEPAKIRGGVDNRVSWPITESARSECSSVMANADLLTLEVLLPSTGVRRKLTRILAGEGL
jgi:hypothetical protein